MGVISDNESYVVNISDDGRNRLPFLRLSLKRIDKIQIKIMEGG